MCVFCTAIPTTLVIGAALNAKQIQEKRENANSAQTTKAKKNILAGRVTLALVGTLVVGSVIYHSQSGG